MHPFLSIPAVLKMIKSFIYWTINKYLFVCFLVYIYLFIYLIFNSGQQRRTVIQDNLHGRNCWITQQGNATSRWSQLIVKVRFHWVLVIKVFINSSSRYLSKYHDKSRRLLRKPVYNVFIFLQQPARVGITQYLYLSNCTFLELFITLAVDPRAGQPWLQA